MATPAAQTRPCPWFVMSWRVGRTLEIDVDGIDNAGVGSPRNNPGSFGEGVRSRAERFGSCFSGGMMKTCVYVDAFNLYYGALKGTPYKWLDLRALCAVMIPKNTVTCIKYFTARCNRVQTIPDSPPANWSTCGHCRPFPAYRSSSAITSRMLCGCHLQRLCPDRNPSCRS